MVREKNLRSKAIALLLCLALSGCETDQQRTVTQGTALGAVGGAILGGLAGAAVGALTGDTRAIIAGAAVGAVAGGTMGGFAGYQWGKRVAFKKSQYITSEDRLNANIRQANQARQAAARENNRLRGEIAKLNNQLKQLSADAAAGNHDRQARITLAQSVHRERQDAYSKIEATENEIADRTEALREDHNGNPQRVAELKNQIASLKEERARMQQANRELGSISARVGV
jgi:hypothetical protein